MMISSINLEKVNYLHQDNKDIFPFPLAVYIIFCICRFSNTVKMEKKISLELYLTIRKVSEILTKNSAW